MTAKNSIGQETKDGIVEYYKEFVRRMNFYGMYYITISNNAVKQYQALEKEAEDLSETAKKTKMNWGKYLAESNRIGIEKKNNELISITFAAMFLECVIWDYSAVNTSQGLTKDYLENLSLVGKWKVIPKLVNNDKNLNLDSRAIALLDKLAKARNNIVHNKSQAIPDIYEQIKKMEERAQKITMPETVECVKRCIEGLQEVDTTDYWLFEEETMESLKI
ncbi:MAG: hypothetical protein PVJ60_00730 [Phycisphaerales bacterium]|jgi:hypothetical protein